VDSLSHAWSGEGGLLDMHSAAAAGSKSRNGFTAWKEITPLHAKLMEAILQSSCHVIVTTRSKTEYVLGENDKGKQVPQKVGTAPVFREGLEYELTVFLELSPDHTASASKDRTGLFDGQYFKPSAETGKALARWLEGGAEPPVPTCADCGCAIAEYQGVAPDVIARTMVKRYGVQLCVACGEKRAGKAK